MTDLIQVSTSESIMRIRMNRPDKKNALTVAMYADMNQALLDAEADSAVRVVMFEGSGDSFSAGNDMNDFLQNGAATDSPVFDFLRTIAAMKKPIVAAVNGVAVGIGTTMLLHCDFVYAAKSAKFVLPFVNLALVPEAASSLLLPLQAGYRKAAELLMLGEPFTPETAKECGIVSEVVGDDALEHAALGTARKLAAKAPGALRLTKQLIRGNVGTIVERMDLEGGHFGELLSSPECREAMMAFVEKRAPDFSKFE